MAKFYGKIGFGVSESDEFGVWTDKITVREYQGDVIRISRRLEPANESLNDNININNELSIIADAYIYEHFHSIRWVEWMGAKWKVGSVTVERPRLILSVGGVYNGPEEDPSQAASGNNP